MIQGGDGIGGVLDGDISFVHQAVERGDLVALEGLLAPLVEAEAA